MSDVFDSRNCSLGEGPLWHPLREQLFWFDIDNKKMLSRLGGTALEWQFDHHVTSAGWVSRDELLIASEVELFLFNLETGDRRNLCPLEADEPETRSNDGRADPWGGFWIGTMGKNKEPQAGAIYRYYKGGLEVLFQDITIPNAICFSPDKAYAYYTDTPTRRIMRQKLKADGWPTGPAEVFVDLNGVGLNPDGAVVDAEGCLWNAQWGASRVARYSAQGILLSSVSFDAEQISCPAFGGDGLQTLFATSAFQDMENPAPAEGQTYFARIEGCQGQPEHRVIL